MDYRKYILPIGSHNYYEGCGFFVGDYFITCGHVIEHAESPFLYILQKQVSLDKPAFLEYSKDTSGYDLAIFHIPGITTELYLYENIIKEGSIAHSVSFKCLGEKLVECDVTIGPDREANYISGLSDIPLKGGCSGSPILMGNQVVGMITGGNNNGDGIPCNPNLPLNLCAVWSPKAIGNVIKVLEG